MTFYFQIAKQEAPVVEKPYHVLRVNIDPHSDRTWTTIESDGMTTFEEARVKRDKLEAAHK